MFLELNIISHHIKRMWKIIFLFIPCDMHHFFLNSSFPLKTKNTKINILKTHYINPFHDNQWLYLISNWGKTKKTSKIAIFFLCNCHSCKYLSFFETEFSFHPHEKRVKIILFVSCNVHQVFITCVVYVFQIWGGG